MPEPGAQDRHDRHLVAQAQALRRFQRRLDLDLLDGQLPRHLDGHDRGRLEHGLAEVAVRCLAVAHHREAVGQHGMLDDCQACGHGRDASFANTSGQPASRRRLASNVLALGRTIGSGRYARAGMAHVNVELKARDPDPEATAARCLTLGADDRGVLEQTDTYFHRPARTAQAPEPITATAAS